MPTIDIELRPVDHLTTDALGEPGKRVFYLHGWQGQRVATLIIEKLQLQTLAVGIEQFLAELQGRFPDLAEASAEYRESAMRIQPPVDPLFRVGEIGLGYEENQDLAVLVVREVVMEGANPEDAGVVRFWCARAQLRALARWGIDVAGRGRPICTQCGEPMDPAGHLCPKKNGHKH